MYKILLSLFIILSISFYSYSKEEKKSIDIDSDNFTLDIKDSTMIFSGNVKIKLNNFSSSCNYSQVFINQKTKKLEKLKMKGNVKIKKDNSEINAESVTFDPINDRLIVEGNVKTKIKIDN